MVDINVDYNEFIEEAAKEHKVDPNLVRAVIHTESNNNPTATSGKGAGGLMQIMPETAKELGIKDVYNPKENIYGGTKYLAQKLKETGGDEDLALASYNAGYGNVQKYGGIPPFKETQDYVKKVRSKYDELTGKSTYQGHGVTGDLPPIKIPWTIERVEEAYNRGELSPEAATELDLKIQLQGNIYEMDEVAIDIAHRKGMITDSQYGNWKMKNQMPFWFQVADFGKAAGKALEDELQSNINAGIELFNFALKDEYDIESVDFDVVEEPQTLTGGVLKGGLQFAIPFIAAGKLLKCSSLLSKLGQSKIVANAVAKYPKLMPMIQESAKFMAQGAVADYVAFDAYEGRLSDLMADYNLLPEYLTFMRTNPNNPAPLERLKTALEGMGIGLAVDAVLMSLRGTKVVLHQRWNNRRDRIAKNYKDKYPDMIDDVDGYRNSKIWEGKLKSHHVDDTKVSDIPEGSTKGKEKIVDPERPDKPISPVKIGKVFNRTKEGLDPEFTDNFMQKIEEADGAVDLFGHIMDEMPYTKGVQTHKMTEELAYKGISKIAKKYGGQPRLMAKALMNEFDNIKVDNIVEKVRGFDMFAVRYAKEVQKLCKEVGKNGTPEEVLKAKQHLVTLSELQDRLYGIRTDSGRLLNQWKMARKESRFKISDLLLEENMDNLENIRKVISIVGDNTKAGPVLEQARYLHKGGWANFMLTYSQTSKLFGLATHARNIVSQTGALVTKLTARGIGSTIQALVTRDSRHLKAYKAEIIGLGHGWEMAMKGMKNLSSTWREAKELNVPFAQAVRENPDIGNFWKATIGRKPVLDSSSKIDASEAVIRARLGGLGTVADTLMKVPFHALVGVDEAFKNVASYSDYFGKIVNEGMDLGKHGDDLFNYLKEEVDKGRPDLLKESLGAGREVTYQEDLGDTSRKLLNFLSNTKLGLGIRALYVPFYTIAINLAKYPVKNSILGLAAKSVRRDLAAGGVKGYETATKIAFGTGMTIWGWGLHADGRITGTILPEDRETYRAANRLEFSYKADNGKSYSLLSGAPFSLWLLLGANLHRTYDEYQNYRNDPAIDKEADKVFAALASIPIDYVVGNTWMQGAKDFMTVVTDPDRLATKGQKVIGRQLEGLFPYGTGNLYDWIRDEFGEENYLYELNTIVDVFRKKVNSFIETDGIIRRDPLYGEQIKKPKSALGMIKKGGQPDPAAEELLRVKYPLTPFREYVRMSGVPVNITPKQVDEIEEIYSTLTDKGVKKTIKQYLNDYIKSKEYKDIKTDEHKREVLGSIIAKYRRGAIETWIERNPRVQKIIEQKKELKYLGESDVTF